MILLLGVRSFSRASILFIDIGTDQGGLYSSKAHRNVHGIDSSRNYYFSRTHENFTDTAQNHSFLKKLLQRTPLEEITMLLLPNYITFNILL